jgi:hypothetical protein
MDLILASLCRLHENVSHLVVPSAALWDVATLKAQIELRQRVLADIENIRCRVRPHVGRQENRGRRRRPLRTGYRRRRYCHSAPEVVPAARSGECGEI